MVVHGTRSRALALPAAMLHTRPASGRAAQFPALGQSAPSFCFCACHVVDGTCGSASKADHVSCHPVVLSSPSAPCTPVRQCSVHTASEVQSGQAESAPLPDDDPNALPNMLVHCSPLGTPRSPGAADATPAPQAVVCSGRVCPGAYLRRFLITHRVSAGALHILPVLSISCRRASAAAELAPCE